jgi:alcohol dehydrogenase (cytochrome c)
VYVYERDAGALMLKPANIWRFSKFSNFVHTLDAKTGAMSGRRDLPLGRHVNLCPSSDGAIAPGAGALNARTGMYYKAGREWCGNIELRQLAESNTAAHPSNTVEENSGADPTLAPQLGADPTLAPQLGATWQLAHPPGRKAFGHVSGRDPLTGATMWEREYAVPPSASLLTTAGDLLFVPHADGTLEALDARDGRTLWSHTNGHAHDGGAISYAVNGKQYVAVVTGWDGASAGSYARLWGEPFASMPRAAGQLIVFALP